MRKISLNCSEKYLRDTDNIFFGFVEFGIIDKKSDGSLYLMTFTRSLSSFAFMLGNMSQVEVIRSNIVISIAGLKIACILNALCKSYCLLFHVACVPFVIRSLVGEKLVATQALLQNGKN